MSETPKPSVVSQETHGPITVQMFKDYPEPGYWSIAIIEHGVFRHSKMSPGRRLIEGWFETTCDQAKEYAQLMNVPWLERITTSPEVFKLVIPSMEPDLNKEILLSREQLRAIVRALENAEPVNNSPVGRLSAIQENKEKA